MSSTETPDTFTVHGKAGGYGDVAITWTDGDGFLDPTGRTAAMIEAGEQVAATPTGPFWPAADTPGTVALLTAKQALDEVTSTEGTDKVDAELDALVALPDGVIA